MGTRRGQGHWSPGAEARIPLERRMNGFALHDIDPQQSGDHQIAVVVDTPRGSRNKYKYDEKLGLFRLSRILPSGMSFPCLRATQKEKGKSIRNDRLIAVPLTPVNRPTLRDLRQLDQTRVDEIEEFFISYNRAQGRKFSPGQRLGHEAAYRLVDAAIRDFRKHGGD